METHKVNPEFIKVVNTLIPNYVFPTVEYNKENLGDDSYIFAPNHTSNYDGYLIWSLLSYRYDLDVFMKKEFWDHFPFLKGVLKSLNVYPLSRRTINHNEIKNEIERIKDRNRSLIIFPHGRHVDPELMLNMPEYNFDTLPNGAFYISAKTNKPIVPIFIEPLKAFEENAVFYGKPISPEDFNIINEKGHINKQNLDKFAKAWLDEINNLYVFAKNTLNREIRNYKIKKGYWTAEGKLLRNEDPNLIMNYYPMLKELLILCYGIDVANLENLLLANGLSSEDVANIMLLKENYENHLQRRRVANNNMKD